MEKLIRRIVIFLVRKRLGLKAYEGFQFDNQKSKTDWYMFTNYEVLKVTYNDHDICQSSVSLNWLLDSKCKVHKIDVSERTVMLSKKKIFTGEK